MGGSVVRKHTGIFLRRLLCAGLLAFASLTLAGASVAADEDGSAVEAPSGLAEDGDSSSAASSGIWDEYDSKEAGHPLRIVAYALHPVGVVIDRLIFRPAWWLGSHEPFHTLFGRTD
jgi:hypothetical protein